MFELTTQIVGTLPTITINDEELSAVLKDNLEVYKNIIFDDTKSAKSDLANLRKLRKELDDKRKELKKEYLKPYEDFEGKVKNLLAIIDEPIALIDLKVKEFEEQRKEEKRALIRQIFEEVFAEYQGNITLESIYHPSWENATVDEKFIRSDMQETKLDIDKDINVLLTFKNDSVDKAIQKYYFNGRNLAGAIEYMNEINNAKEEVKKAYEEKAKQRVAEAVAAAQEGIGFATGNQIEVHIAVLVDEDGVDELMTLLFTHGYKAERTI